LKRGRSLPLWTSTRSAAPRETLNAVHTHDVSAGLVPTTLSSNAVAVAKRDLQQRRQGHIGRCVSSVAGGAAALAETPACMGEQHSARVSAALLVFGA
jgi:hypothetical protein